MGSTLSCLHRWSLRVLPCCGGRSALSLSVIVFFIKPTALSEIAIKPTAPNKHEKSRYRGLNIGFNTRTCILKFKSVCFLLSALEHIQCDNEHQSFVRTRLCLHLLARKIREPAVNLARILLQCGSQNH